jgi:hypothetical protein
MTDVAHFTNALIGWKKINEFMKYLTKQVTDKDVKDILVIEEIQMVIFVTEGANNIVPIANFIEAWNDFDQQWKQHQAQEKPALAELVKKIRTKMTAKATT